MYLYALLVICCAALFLFAYLMDKWHGATLAVAVVAVLFSTQPAHAASDADWPSINDEGVAVLYTYTALGHELVLFANFCAGSGAHADHMHTYGIYDSHKQFIQGGCWKFDPTGTRKTKTIQYFSMSGGGWNTWPLHAFKVAPALNIKCRGESGDKSSTWQACNERDAAQFN
jgi:hypothetical protein